MLTKIVEKIESYSRKTHKSITIRIKVVSSIKA